MFNGHQLFSNEINSNKATQLVSSIKWATVQNSDPPRFLVLILNTSLKKKKKSAFSFYTQNYRSSNKMFSAAEKQQIILLEFSVTILKTIWTSI